MADRRARHSREEIRELLLRTGSTILREEGAGSSGENLSFKRVFARLEGETGLRLTNASVIRRVWRNVAEFKAEVLVSVALSENDDEIDHTVEAVSPVLEHVDLSTPLARQQAMRELCRVGGAANLQAMRLSDNWPLWINAWEIAAAGPQDDFGDKTKAALVAGYDAFNERIEEVYMAMISLLGFRLRERFSLRQFTIAVDCLGQGCGLRDRVDNTHMRALLRATGLQGTEQEWTLFAVGFEALVFEFFELDPDWRPDRGDA